MTIGFTARRANCSLAGRDAIRAAQAFDAGIALWPGERVPEDEEVRHELSQMIGYRAFLYERDGNYDGALELFRRSAELFPKNKAIAKRIEELERGEVDREWTEEAWAHLFPRVEICDREVHDEEPGHVHGPDCGHEKH